jgi:hypothetical protein
MAVWYSLKMVFIGNHSLTLSDMAKEVNMKTVEVYIDIPGLKVKWDMPVIGSKLKDNCTVQPTFNKK